MTRWLAASLLVPLAACQAHLRAPAGLRSLGDEAEVFVYLRPLPPEAERLSIEVAGIAVVAVDGTEIPLHLRLSTVKRSQLAGERLFAVGRLPPGRYEGFAIRFASASIAAEDGPAALLVSKEPSTAVLSWSAARGTATVVALSLGYPPMVERTFGFEPSLAALISARPVPDTAALCSNAGMASLTIADRRTRNVAAVLPTGGSPRGLAIDAAGRRIYVAASDEDAVQVFDLASGSPLGRVRLSPGDRPWDLALAPDGRTLVVANAGSSTASFVDVANLAELRRVPTGETPSSVLRERGDRPRRGEPGRGHDGPHGSRAAPRGPRRGGAAALRRARRVALHDRALAAGPRALGARVRRARRVHGPRGLAHGPRLRRAERRAAAAGLRPLLARSGELRRRARAGWRHGDRRRGEHALGAPARGARRRGSWSHHPRDARRHRRRRRPRGAGP